MNAHLVICNDPGILNAEAARRFASLARESVESQGLFTVALSGGTTPRALYSLIAEPDFEIPWESVHLFFSDERCVPPDDPTSNFRMANEALISRVSIPRENIHRMRGELAPERAAEEYNELLVTFFSAPLPRFDLVLLGIGEDGHTASLFPGSETLRETSAAVTAVYVETPGVYRLTLTPPAINNAAEVVFLVSGDAKAEAVKEVIEGKYRPSLFPAQFIRPTTGRLTFMMDRAASRLLTMPRDSLATVVEIDATLQSEDPN